MPAVTIFDLQPFGKCILPLWCVCDFKNWNTWKIDCTTF